MKKTDNLLKYLLYIALVCIGIVIGIVIHNTFHLPITQEINIIDLATLVTTIFLAIYIPEVLDRKLQVKKDKKYLIEGRIEDLQTLHRRINLIIQNEKPLSAKNSLIVKNTLDIIQHRLALITSLLRFSNMSPVFELDIKRIQALTKEHKELLLPQNANSDELIYDDDIQQKEELLYNQIDEATSLLIFKLSEA